MTVPVLTLQQNAKGLLMQLVEKNTGIRIKQTFVNILQENALMLDLGHVVNNIDLMTTNFKTMCVRFQHLIALKSRMVLAVKSTKKKVLKKISANLRLLNALMSMKELARKSIEKYLMNRAMFASIQYLNAK